jgi:hypothetical protein
LRGWGEMGGVGLWGGPPPYIRSSSRFLAPGHTRPRQTRNRTKEEEDE